MSAYEQIPIGVLGGVNLDLPPQDLDNQTYTTMHNLRIKDKRIVPVQGHDQVFATGMPTSPKHVLGTLRQGTPTIFIATDGGGLWQNQNGLWTSVGSTSSGGDAWNSTILNNCIFMNNGTDRLKVLEVVDSSFKDSVNLPANFTAKVFRSFNNYLFALNINETGVSQLPTVLRWSDPADPGTEPPSWDVADPTTQAGQLALADTEGAIVDALQLRDQLMIYKTDAVYSCQFIGGVFVFAFQKIIGDRGILSADCVTKFENNHFVVGYDDIYVHDGLQARSVAEGKVKTYFYKHLNQDYMDNVFCFSHNEEKEVWVCYPDDESLDGTCNQALVWNWVYNSWSTRDIPHILSSSLAVVDPKVDDIWDAGADDTWDLGELHWDANNYSRANLSVLMASPGNNSIDRVNDTGNFGAVPFDFVLEKTSFSYGSLNNIKYLNHLTPDIEGQGVLSHRFGHQNHLGEGIKWNAPSQFTLGRFRMWARGAGRYFSQRFYGNTVDVYPSIGGLDSFITVEGEK